jgi:hypothetical protein
MPDDPASSPDNLAAIAQSLAADPDNAPFLAALDLVATGYSQKKASAETGISGPRLWAWANRTAERRELYAHAREGQARALADETLEISDAATNEGERVARLRVDTRKWLASKLLPKEYGDRLEVSGTFANLDVRQLTDDQVRRLADGEAPASVLTAVIPRALPAPEPLPNVVAGDDDAGA